jgi:hypothetical protein
MVWWLRRGVKVEMRGVDEVIPSSRFEGWILSLCLGYQER